MNIRRLRGLVWLGTVAVTSLAGWEFTKILEAAKGGEFDAETVPEFAARINIGTENNEGQERTPPARQSDFDVIWESRINGWEPPAVIDDPVETEDGPPKFNIKPIEEVVELTNYVADGDGGGVAYVKYNDDFPATDIREIVLEVGSRLKYPYDEDPFSASVVDIRPAGVVVNWGGKEFTLRTNLKDVDQDKASSAAGPARDEGLSAKEVDLLRKFADTEETVKLTELPGDNYLVGTQDRALFGSRDEAWRSMIRVGEQSGPNGRREVVLSTVKPGMTKRYGVKSGDILISINGTSVTSRSQAVRYVNQNPDLPKYEVVFERKGERLSKTIYVPSD